MQWRRTLVSTLGPCAFVGLAVVLQSAACSSDESVAQTDVPDGAPDDTSAAGDASKHDGSAKDASGHDANVGATDAAHDAAQIQGDGAIATDAGTPDAAKPPLDVTFYVLADTHADPVEEYDLRAMAKVVNTVSKAGKWPAQIDGTATGFTGGSIAPPRGVVIAGDLTGWGTAPTEIPMYKHYFEKGASTESIVYPSFIGLGNHDIDSADRDPVTATAYRALYWQFIDARYRGPSAVVPVTNFDDASHNYSWDWGGVHLIQTHRFPGDVGYGLGSSTAFVAADLKKYASDGRPVFLFHHYGMDAFGTQDRWWTQADRDTYRALLKGYGVTAIFAGHSHYPMQYSWQGLRVFQVNNAKAEIDAGNNDGNGSFAIVRITDNQLDIVTCRWKDDQGNYELIAPFFSGPSNVGLAP